LTLFRALPFSTSPGGSTRIGETNSIHGSGREPNGSLLDITSDDTGKGVCKAQMLRYDVFGREVGIIREGGGWRAVFVGQDGKLRDAPEIVIPPWVKKPDLGRFLADLFHESASPARSDVVFIGPGAPAGPQVTLTEYSASEHREQVRRWLGRSHVSRWWGDPEAALDFIDAHASDLHAIICEDGRAVGYICWQSIPAEEKVAAGLTGLPEQHIDIDLLIGEAGRLGEGIGSGALCLLVDRLVGQGVPSIGLAADEDNSRALRAYEKAGFCPFAHFVEGGRKMCYLRHLPKTP
jgi:aminoglycoside 6'-N-acetyltransferase